VSLQAVPSLDHLADDPAHVDTLSPETARSLLLRLAPLQEALRLRALTPPVGNNQPEAPALGRPAQTAAQTERPDSRQGRKPDAHSDVGRNLLSVKQVAERLSCSEAAVRKWAYRRQLPAVKVGRLTRFRFSDVEALITRGSRPARADTR